MKRNGKPEVQETKQHVLLVNPYRNHNGLHCKIAPLRNHKPKPGCWGKNLTVEIKTSNARHWETRNCCKSAMDSANNADRYNHDGIYTAAGHYKRLLEINLVRTNPTGGYAPRQTRPCSHHKTPSTAAWTDRSDRETRAPI